MPAERRRPDPAWVGAVGSAVGFVLLVVVLTPWHPLPGAPPVTAHVADYFTPGEIHRTEAFHDAVKWPSWIGLLVQLGLAVLLGFTGVGRRLLTLVRRITGRWWLQTVLASVAFVILQTVAGLPFAVWEQHVTDRYGLTTGDWFRFTTDIATGVAVSAVLTTLALLVLVALARRFGQWWFAVAAGLATGVVVLSSFAYPVVFEPLFNHFTPLPAGSLRTEILDLAARARVDVSDILVANASQRTTAEDAYVSGFGATKRVVLFDTLVRSAPRGQIRLVVAHELGHVKHQDVRNGTAEGALAAAAAMCGLAVLIRRPRIRRPLGVRSMGDPAAVPLVLAIFVLASFVGSPIQQGLSRKVEAHADAYALELTHDPRTFIAMQRRLALSNLDHLDPNPVLSFWFDSHPTTMQRIAMALEYERMHPGVR
jgi:STE24 endopeptidase